MAKGFLTGIKPKMVKEIVRVEAVASALTGLPVKAQFAEAGMASSCVDLTTDPVRIFIHPSDLKRAGGGDKVLGIFCHEISHILFSPAKKETSAILPAEVVEVLE